MKVPTVLVVGSPAPELVLALAGTGARLVVRSEALADLVWDAGGTVALAPEDDGTSPFGSIHAVLKGRG